MKRILSLVMAASILLQTVIPAAKMVTYAQTGEFYGLKWERGKSLSRELVESGVKAGEGNALVSWKVGEAAGSYTLEYFVEDETGTGGAEKVQLTLNREDIGAKATVEVKVLDSTDQPVVGKAYKRFNLDSIGSGDWIDMVDDDNGKKLIALQKGSTYPGASILVGSQLEIRFRWSSDNIFYVQTNTIKKGNITPFQLTHDKVNIGKSDVVDVLTALEEYKISPIHIELKNGKISDKKTIVMPGTEYPGSKPGIKIEFKHPRRFKKSSFKFEPFDEAEAGKMGATLDISDLTNISAQLSFKLSNNAKITGLDNTDKNLIYENGTYTLYLAQDDVLDGVKHNNIVKWEALQGSSIFTEIDLSLVMDADGDNPQTLGTFVPIEKDKNEDIGRYTYLKYTIERSSLQDAYIEVEPYKGAINTEFTYAVESAPDGQTWKTLVEHKYMSTSVDDNIPITIPVPFASTDNDRYYRIVVKYSQGTMYSQILHYKPKEDLTIPPPTPIIQNIDNIYAVPPIKVGNQPETIGFDLTWSAPRNAADAKILEGLLAKGNIYYELSLHNTPEADKDAASLIKVFKVSSPGGNAVKVEPYAGTAGKDPAGVRYNPAKDTFTMENVVLKNQGLEETEGWEQISGIPKDYDENTTSYPIKKDPTKNDIDDDIIIDNKLNDKEAPGIYYLTMRALYEPKATTGAAITMGISNESNPKSITISPLEEVIPVPTKIESSNVIDEANLNRIQQSLSWGNIDLQRYIKQMLEPLNLSIDDSKRTYEVYLYQKKNIEQSNLIKTTPSAIDLDMTKAYKVNDKDIKVLREGGGLRLDYAGSNNTGMNSITVEGLDANQVYYLVIRVRLDVKSKDGNHIESRHSVFSKEHSFTTYVKPGEPGPGERVPPVPEDLQVVDQPNNTTATIGWKAPNYSKQESEELYYEMARVDSRELAKEEDSRLISIEDLMKKDTKNDIQAWRTKNPFIYQYEKSTATWKEATPQQTSSKLQLEDESLNPNKIYYYYVRTVLMVEGEEVYSSWVGIPVTTDPIKKPINLKVEDASVYPHDPKREIVISFLAPIPKDAKVPSEYDFDIAVQGELDADYRLDYSKTSLVSKEAEKDIPTGYAHFVYKIRNVKPGKRYDLKVRVIDKVVEMVNGQYPKSLYSDRVTTRTHFDQDEQDKDDKFAEYLKYFEDKVEALRRKPYWTLDDNKNTFSIKYRSNYIIPEINSGTYKLAIKEDVSNFTYYMPASVIESMNTGQTSFEIKQGDVTYIVRPLTITTELEEVRVTLEDISAKDIRDYYVAFHFGKIPQTISLSGDGFLTPKIIVDIELVKLKEEDLFLEDDIMIALNKEINREKARFINELERALEKGKILKEDLDIIINSSVEKIEKSHQKDVTNILRTNTRKSIWVNTWGKNMLIMAMIEGNAIAQGYLLGSKDTELPTFNVSGGYAVEANLSGTYAFKGQKVIMPTIPGVGGASNLITKYQLTDFFGTNGTINPNNMAVKKDVLGAMARVLGAQRGADYIQFLKQANIKGVTNVGMYLPMKKGEGIYLLMQVYEKNLKKPIGSVYVKNRNILTNIREFNPLHQPYMLVATDSKIISIGNGIRPNDTMQIKDVLEVLTNIMTGLR